MIHWDKDKISTLAEYLKKQSQNNIYQQASPLDMDKVDLAADEVLGNGTATFIKELLNGNGKKVELQLNGETAQKFHHLYLEQTNAKQQQGKHHLGFGYPFFIHKEEVFQIHPKVSPFFIWPVEIEPLPYRVDTWNIRRITTENVRINTSLIAYIEEKWNVDLGIPLQNIMAKGTLDANELSAFCNKISVALGIAGNTSSLAMIPAPQPDEIKDVEEEPIIRFSGTLGIYPPSTDYLLQELEKFMELQRSHTLLSHDSVQNDFQHPFSIVQPDPCQKHIGQQVMEQALTLAEGASGTGKTTLALHAASHALAHGKTCLVVSPKLASLKYIRDTLKQQKMGDLALIFQNSDHELANVHHTIKQFYQNKYSNNPDLDLSFQISLERVLNRHDKIQNHHQLLNQTAFGNHDFTDTVGHYIHSNRFAGKDILAGKLDARDYQFTFREYDILKADIIKGERLYKDIHQLNHPLQVLHEDIFLNQEMEKAETFIHNKLGYYKAKCEALLKQYSESIESYRDNMRDHYEEHATELHEKVEDIQYKIAEYAQVFGEDFKKSSSTKLRMYGVFSDTYFNIKEARDEINQDFGTLVDMVNDKRYFNYQFPNRRDADTIQNIQARLAEFKEMLQEWASGIPLLIKQQSKMLSSKTVLNQLDYKSSISELEHAHDVLLEELNQAQVFKEWLGYEDMTMDKRKTSLEELYQLLCNTELKMVDFPAFHPWHKHWLEVLPITKETIRALVASYTKEWLPAFNSWYFYHCLSDRSFTQVRTRPKDKERFVEEMAQFRQQLPQKTNQVWNKKRTQAFEQLKKRDKKLYQMLTTKKGQLPERTKMRNLFQSGKSILSQCFPLMLMTAETAGQLLPGTDTHYDLIIIDDAHDVNAADGIALMQMGHRNLIIGDRHQILPKNELPNIMDMLIEAGANALPLYYQHQPREKYGADFINHTAYQKNIKHIQYFKHTPSEHKGIFLHVFENSRYDEETAINKLEAENLIRIVAEERPATDDGHTPKTAIVTLTMAQRDYIHTQILHLQQKRNPLSDNLQKLQQAGLRVLHISELNEDFETIVWSSVYGSINLRGQITNHLNKMEGSYAQQAINRVLGHATHAVVVCTSIPMKIVDERIWEGTKSTGPFLQFLKYAALVNDKKYEEATQFLAEIEWEGVRKEKRDFHSFAEQIRKELIPYFEPGRVLNSSPLAEIGTASLTIEPLHEEQPTPLIIADSLDRNVPAVAIEFEEKAKKMLEKTDYRIYHTHSLDWWKNPKRAARMLASKLIKADQQYAIVAETVTQEENA